MNEEQFKEWLKREMPEGTVIGNPEWWAKKIWQAALSAKSVPEQMGSPIQKLMEYLTNILDEDEFNQCDSILAGQGISAPQPTDERVRELEKDAARYRWLRKGASDEVAVVCGLGAMDYGMSSVAYTYSEEIDGDDLDTTIDQAIASMSGEQK